MPHIHTGEGEHDHTASVFIIRAEDGQEPKILLHRHKKLGILLQFGGHIELNETPWQAVVHEIQEESGYDIDQLDILQPTQRITALQGDDVLHPYPVVIDTHPFDETHFHSDTAFAFVTEEAPRHSLAEGESEDIHALTREELVELTETEITDSVKIISLFVIDVCLKEWDRVSASEFKA